MIVQIIEWISLIFSLKLIIVNMSEEPQSTDPIEQIHELETMFNVDLQQIRR
jgi:hypothetical protein